MSESERFLQMARENCPDLFESLKPATGAATGAATNADLIPIPEKPVPEGVFTRKIDVSESLTRCLQSAPCPDTARKIFRILHLIALGTTHARGLPNRPSVAIFHLPVELLAAHLKVDRVTIWRNVKPLIRAGILDAHDHKDTYCGEVRVTGKLWAVSVVPERILKGEQRAVRLTQEDIAYKWRDLTRDIQNGRTAYAMTRTDEQMEADRLRKESEPAAKRLQREERAKQRKKERTAALKRGERVLTGRAAAVKNAAETREASKGKNNVQKPKTPKTQQSIRKSLKAIDEKNLLDWALTPFLDSSNDVSMIVTQAISGGLDVVFTLRSLVDLSKADRTAAVEKTAEQLAAMFEDHANVKFWAWLVWQLIRGHGQGQDYFDDVSHVLARVLHDVKHDETMDARTLKKPASIVVKELKKSGLLDALRELQRWRVGKKPR